jgi:hypothetical protein
MIKPVDSPSPEPECPNQCELCQCKDISDEERAALTMVLKLQEKAMIQQHGFMYHIVPGTACGGHTHGFTETWGFPELEVGLPFDPRLIARVFWIIADLIKDGAPPKVGDEISTNAEHPNAFITLAKSPDPDRSESHYRIIVSDEDGNVTPETCKFPYSEQWKYSQEDPIPPEIEVLLEKPEED